jgi:hypothetical protein
MKTIPIQTLDLFPKLDAKLIELLKSLSVEDWEKQTLAPLWTVKDIAVHLLDGNIRALSMLRDGYFGEKPENINSYNNLLVYLNRLNADWVKAMKRISPKVLVELLESTGKEYFSFLQSLDPFAQATFSVAWAGENVSENWFHIAREYTEKWHHQQQIRLVIGKESELYSFEFYMPYLETSMRALPYHYRDVKGEKDDVIKFEIIDFGAWYLYYNGDKWLLKNDCEIEPISVVLIKSKIAWRIFTKGITKQEAEIQSNIFGKIELGAKIFEMLAVMA